jgi:hypothetical protein
MDELKAISKLETRARINPGRSQQYIFRNHWLIIADQCNQMCALKYMLIRNVGDSTTVTSPITEGGQWEGIFTAFKVAAEPTQVGDQHVGAVPNHYNTNPGIQRNHQVVSLKCLQRNFTEKI